MSPTAWNGLDRTIVFVGSKGERHAMFVSVSDRGLRTLLQDLKAKVKTRIDETSEVLQHFEVMAIHCLNGWVLAAEKTKRQDLKKLMLTKATEYRGS